MKFLSTNIYLLVGIICLSCNKYDQVGEPVDKITIKVQQKITATGPKIYLLCQGGNFECSGIPISYDLQKTNTSLYLEFGDTYGSDCNSRPEGYPAYVYVDLGKPEIGNYLFDITNRKKTLHCQMKVEEGKCTFSNTQSVSVSFNLDPTIIYFVPNDAIWGYVKSSPVTNANYFLDSLQDLQVNSYADNLEDGDYYFFTMNNHRVYFDYSDAEITPFVLKSSLDTAALRDVMRYYCQSEFVTEIYIKSATGAYLFEE